MGKKLIIIGADFSANSLPKALNVVWKEGFVNAGNAVFYPNGQPNLGNGLTSGWKSTDNQSLPAGAIGKQITIKYPGAAVMRLTFSKADKVLISSTMVTVNNTLSVVIPANSAIFSINVGKNGETLNPDNTEVSKLTEAQIAQIQIIV